MGGAARPRVVEECPELRALEGPEAGPSLLEDDRIQDEVLLRGEGSMTR
ncbi:hypothetical protein QFZ63_000062 [Streptomyces sp. B3I7]|nr:hypothetical protein [Streptomyces sp. B3I7]